MKDKKKQLSLIKKFIDNSNKFWNDHNIKNLDSKHKKILKNFSHRYKQNIKLFSDEIIDWESQSNLGAPFQLSLKKIKYSSLRQILSIFKGLSIQNYFNKMSFFVDL